MSGMKNGYKISEIGIIPEDWEVVALGSVFKLSSGEMLSQKLINNGKHPVYGGNGINGYHNQYLFEEPKIVIGRVGAKCGCIHYTKPYSWITDNALYISKRLRPFNDQYLLNHLESLNLNFYANQNAQPVISGTKIYPIQIPFPPLPEQQKIADILTTVDDHINETEALIEKTKILKQGLMQQLLTKGIGHTEFKDTEIGRIPVGWEVVPFNSVVYFQEGPGLRNWQYAESGIPFLNIRCLQNGAVDRKNIQYISIDEFNSKYSHFALNKGDIVVSSSGTLGKKAIICESDLPIMLNTSIIRLRSNDASKLEMAFLNYYVESDYYQKAVAQESVGSAQANYGPYHLNRIKILLPPLSEQHQIAAILTSVDDQIDTHQAKLASLTRLKTGLMQQLLTGKIRVTV